MNSLVPSPCFPPCRSYAWRYPIRLVVGALSEWCKTSALDPKEQYVWIDVICWNQHPGRLADPVAEWVPRVTAIGTQLTMLHPWSRSVYMTRGCVTFGLDFGTDVARCNACSATYVHAFTFPRAQSARFAMR